MQKKEEKERRSLLSRLLSVFRAQDAHEMSDTDVRRKLMELLQKKEPTASWIDAVFEDYFVYSSFDNAHTNGISYYRRDYSEVDDSFTIGDTRVEVEPVITYEPVDSNEESRAARERGCVCHHKPKERDMTKMERVKALIAKAEGRFKPEDEKFLESASDEQLTRFEAQAADDEKTRKAGEDRAAADAKTKADEDVKVKAAADAKAKEEADAKAKAGQPEVPTFDSLLQAAKPEVREAIETSLKTAADKKVATVKMLRDSNRCDLTDEQLNAKPQVELDALVKLAGIEVKASVDFGGRGGPKDNQALTEVPAPPSLSASIKDAQGKK